MMVGTVARRYGKAFFSLARDRGKIETLGAQLAEIVQLAEENRDFDLLLADPVIDPKVKKNVLTKILAGEMANEIVSFLCLLCDRRRERILPQIAAAYRELADAAGGVLEVEAETAVAVGEKEQEQLREAISEATKKEVRLVVRVSPQLLGGMKLRLGDRVLDTSLAGGLRRLGAALRQARLGGL